MKVASIVGARPNFVKLAPVSRELRKSFDEVIIHTGQHYNYEMDRIFFDDLGIPAPDYHLGIGSGSHGRQTGEMLSKIEEILQKEDPDAVVVFGDTNTTLAGALAAAKMNIPLAHIEAGLRSFDRRMPEEVNRVLVDHCSDMLFCPTQTAVDNLAAEGITKGVSLTGDVMVDILRECLGIAEDRSAILEDLDLLPGSYYLATVHRASNTDDPKNLQMIAESLEDIEEVVFPCHPRTEKYLKEYGLYDTLKEKVHLIEPVGYLDMLVLEGNAKKILTDSGGVQKEAYILGVPCVTLRENTEWVETLEGGWNVLVGADGDAIIDASREPAPAGRRGMAFGKGDASERIAREIKEGISR